MRFYTVTEDPGAPPYVAAEFGAGEDLEGFAADRTVWAEECVERLYPEALAEWRARAGEAPRPIVLGASVTAARVDRDDDGRPLPRRVLRIEQGGEEEVLVLDVPALLAAIVRALLPGRRPKAA